MSKKETSAIGLKCRLCNQSKYREVFIDLPYKGILIPNVQALQCNNCKEILFTLEQHKAVRQKIIFYR